MLNKFFDFSVSLAGWKSSFSNIRNSTIERRDFKLLINVSISLSTMKLILLLKLFNALIDKKIATYERDIIIKKLNNNFL